jgi:hypothetical protein
VAQQRPRRAIRLHLGVRGIRVAGPARLVRVLGASIAGAVTPDDDAQVRHPTVLIKPSASAACETRVPGQGAGRQRPRAAIRNPLAAPKPMPSASETMRPLPKLKGDRQQVRHRPTSHVGPRSPSPCEHLHVSSPQRQRHGVNKNSEEGLPNSLFTRGGLT